MDGTASNLESAAWSRRSVWNAATRWGCGLAVVAVAAVNMRAAVENVPLFGDERDWIARTYFARLAFVEGDFDHPRWGELDGIDHPHIAEFLIAAALVGDGEALLPVPGRNFAWLTDDEMPAGRRLRVARAPSAALGAATALVVYLIGLASTGRLLVGAVAGLAYACHPLATESAARAMSDGPLLFCSCLTVLLLTLAMPQPRGQDCPRAFTPGRVAALLGAAISAGVTTGVKLTGLVVVAAVALALFVTAFGIVAVYGRRAWPWATWATLGLLVTTISIVGSNPTLYRDPRGRLTRMIAHRLDTSRKQMDYWSSARLDTASDRFLAAGGYLVWQYPPYLDSGWPLLRVWLAPLGAMSVAWWMATRVRRWKLLPLAAWFVANAVILVPNQPMDWPRYFLPAVPCWELFTGIGLSVVVAETIEVLKRLRDFGKIQMP